LLFDEPGYSNCHFYPRSKISRGFHDLALDQRDAKILERKKEADSTISEEAFQEVNQLMMSKKPYYSSQSAARLRK
jgi:hypothetical protein